MDKEMNISAIIGIDPGGAGGIAVFIPGCNVKVAKMPKDVRNLRDFFEYYAENYKPIVFIEKLSVRPDDVIMKDDKAAMGKLYRIQHMMANYEHLIAMIETFEIPYVRVHPISWQTKLKLRVKGEKIEKAQRKRNYQNKAASLYPEVKVTLWNADALLIMHFGRWALMNDKKWVKEQLPEREYQKLF